MPFGIFSTPQHFQERMRKFLSGPGGVLCLMDDVLMLRKDEKEHNHRLAAVLKKIETPRVTFIVSKYEFRKNQLKFLGHLIKQQEIQVDPDKTSAIRKIGPPANIAELQHFFVMVN